MVFFATSRFHHPGARHVLYSNDDAMPVIDGVDCTDELKALDVEIVFLPFHQHVPPVGSGRIFRNNFYKLDVIHDACRRYAGRIVLGDADVVWVNPLPAEWDGDVCVYRAFADRTRLERSPNGISVADLESFFESISGRVEQRSVHWIGGELIAGDSKALVGLSDIILESFSEWCSTLADGQGVFANGTSVFDNDEVVLSFAVSRFPGAVSSGGRFLRRIWTETQGGGDIADGQLSMWHLPNEKMRGFQLLFDDLFVDRCQLSSELIGGSCGVPDRKRHYRPRQSSARLKRGLVRAVRLLLPVFVYNIVRRAFGRAPI